MRASTATSGKARILSFAWKSGSQLTFTFFFLLLAFSGCGLLSFLRLVVALNFLLSGSVVPETKRRGERSKNKEDRWSHVDADYSRQLGINQSISKVKGIQGGDLAARSLDLANKNCIEVQILAQIITVTAFDINHSFLLCPLVQVTHLQRMIKREASSIIAFM